MLITWYANGQSCNCPQATNCGACDGGITSLTLRFNATSSQSIVISDDGGTLFNRLVTPGEEFTITGSLPNDKFKGGEVRVSTSGSPVVTITTDCSLPVYSGSVFGSFTVISGTSKNGGTLCCKPPVISSCPSNIITTLSTSCSKTVTWTPPIATSSCSSITLTSTKASGSAFPRGTTPVTYTATDVFGNTATCTFNVTINDVTPPTITGCPSHLTVTANASCQAVVNWTPPTAADNCAATLSTTHSPGATFPVGTTLVKYTATDVSGNTATCSFNVMVNDTNKPEIRGCPTNVTITADASCQAKVSWIEPTISDCSTTSLISNYSSGSAFPVGTTEVVYTAIDQKGNSAQCKFNIIVNDQSAPVFSNCITEVIARTGASCDIRVSWTEPVATDQCGGVTLTSSHRPGDIFAIGTTQITYTAADKSGNKAVCKFNVIVNNETLPVISGCPSNMVAKANEYGHAVVTWEKPTATSACSEVALTSTHNSGDVFSTGTTRIEYVAVDDGGNSSRCSFLVNVIVEDLELEIPQIITPDGDGINDLWRLSNIEKYKENKIIIVDRWGSVIYSASGYNNESVVWSGTNISGGVVPTGTYFYTISMKSDTKHTEKRGFIELIR